MDGGANPWGLPRERRNIAARPGWCQGLEAANGDPYRRVARLDATLPAVLIRPLVPGPVRRLARVIVAGLVAAGALAACDASVPATPPITPGTSGSPRQVNVILRDYQFLPGIVDLVPGETITLNVVNGGLDVHELVLGTLAVQQAWEDAETQAANPPPGPTPVVSVPPGIDGLRVVVASGVTRTVTYSVPRDIAGQLLLGCHISDHWERGMAGAIRLVGPGGAPLETPGASPEMSGPPPETSFADAP